MIGHLFHIILFQPLYNALVFLVNVLPFHDLGSAIIILTVAVRFIILPLTHRSIVTQRKMKEIEPELANLKKKFKNNREEQTRQTMALYRSHGVSPFSGFLLLLIQFPILIALFMLLREGANFKPEELYSFISFPEQIKTVFLGLIDMSKPSYLLAALAGFSQFYQIRLSLPKSSQQTSDRSFKAELQKSMAVQMKYMMPLFVFYIATRFSSGMALYWTTSNVFAIVHEIIVAKKADKIHGSTDANHKKINRGSFGETKRRG